MSGTTVAERLRGQVRPAALAGEQVLPVAPALGALIPAGVLRRGSTVVVTGAQGVTSLTLALLGAAMGAGSWAAVVGVPDLGLVAAAELGVTLDRLALVPSVPAGQWVRVVGALLDSVDLVVAQPPRHLRLGDARRLTARARERRSVLVPAGAWAEGADLRLEVTGGGWEGPGEGSGRLTARRLEVTAAGRGAAARPRRATLWLPAPGGGIELAAPSYAGADIDRLVDPVDPPVAAWRTAG